MWGHLTKSHCSPERIAGAIRDDGTIDLLKGFHLKRSCLPTESCYGVSVPAFCVIAQGSKEVLSSGQ